MKIETFDWLNCNHVTTAYCNHVTTAYCNHVTTAYGLWKHFNLYQHQDFCATDCTKYEFCSVDLHGTTRVVTLVATEA
jgi:hypothetical protein